MFSKINNFNFWVQIEFLKLKFDLYLIEKKLRFFISYQGFENVNKTCEKTLLVLTFYQLITFLLFCY